MLASINALSRVNEHPVRGGLKSTGPPGKSAAEGMLGDTLLSSANQPSTPMRDPDTRPGAVSKDLEIV
jgi:hypothetical protein